MGYNVEAYDIDLRVVNLPAPLQTEMAQWGFYFDTIEGETWLNEINGKWSTVEEYLESMAPYVVQPAHIYFQGEDGEHWLMEYNGNKLSTYEGHVVFDECASQVIEYKQ